MTVISYGEVMGVFSVNDGKFMHRDSAQFHIAGAEANTMIGLSKLGVASQFISAIGNDGVGDAIQYQLRGEGIGTQFLTSLNNYSTGIMTKERSVSNTIRVDYFRKFSAINHYEISYFFKTIFESATILYITGITPSLSQLTYETTISLIKGAKERGITVIFDPNYRKKLWNQNEFKKFYKKIAKDIDILLTGSSEANILFGNKTNEEIVKETDAKLLVIKDGSNGAFFANHEESFFKEAYKVKEIDSIGAGDAFAAGLIYGIQKYNIDDLSQLSKYALAMGALATTSYGDFYGLPTLNELNQFLNHQLSDVER
ncbi:sugar kinase [Staphylococcus pseudoxylosus]|uniref:sugar kinase n=1 Tax=Staphylococcus pseudoxylosus TaxID=2282419 RepID=UPI000F539E53|nr:sugar kinase [Staphylococcus pseudoxylosus]MEB6036506.1 sugar kinase [Staphylococcus pseudoxylosus]MEB7763558.1 sugar kinase [Staphylococcus pseudoxylosus]MEB8085863.1 sugar kinase [Staphylococcus pseudoxylosus]RQM84157.1 2-dehydro-3-deoxygluconokinase [Staphylococcus xylosus]